MKNKKKILIFVILFVVVILFGFYYLFTKQDKKTSFTIMEKQWLENNKSKVLDISILKDIPVINYNGNGILFDFLTDFEDVTGLEFNHIAYQLGDVVKSDYSFQVVDQKGDNDILVYTDNYALLTKNNIKYNKLSEIDNMVIGVLESDLVKVQSVMSSLGVTIHPYATIDELLAAINQGVVVNEDGTTTGIALDGIIVPKMSNLDLIISNENLNISYNISEIKQDYVIKLGNDEKLNEIITKYFKKWYDTKYEESFGNHFSNNYFSFAKIGDKEKAEFKSKRYVYGYVDNYPYDAFINSELYGINQAFLEDFSNISEVDIEYKKFENIDSLVNSFNNSEIDILFDYMNISNYTIPNINLVSNYDEQVVVLALPDSKVTVSSVKSLVGYDVATIENTKIHNYLVNNGISVNTYSSVSELLTKVKKDSIIVLDFEVYNYYSSKQLDDYKSIYLFNIDEQYSFKVSDNDLNKNFIKYFNFYLSFVSNQEISNIGYSNLMSLVNHGNYRIYIIIGVCLLVALLIFILFFQKRTSKNKVVISKDNKIKYIDVMTSLKNRNYLNDNIDAWDESLVYPQGIVIVDLNNIAYINDNYGHSEGDKVITEAANILIKTQITNTEIIRTNGNEFLVYMVGYDEKQIVSYIRKLNKEFKELSHNFGAAIGYSIITDEIKTIDDAINEATLDMRNNKEENR